MDDNEIRDVYSAGIIVYQLRAGQPEFLLVRHRDNRHWCPPKGHLEPHETRMNAALRECQEETGITEDQLALAKDFAQDIAYLAIEHGQHVRKAVTYFLGRASKEVGITVDTDHNGYCWVTLQEAYGFITHHDLMRIIEQAFCYATGIRFKESWWITP